jgi:hypothetical protein
MNLKSSNVVDFTRSGRRIDYNWETVINQLNSNDTVLFLIGANDIPKDRKSYEKRVSDLISLSKSKNLNLIWLGIPNLTRGDLASKVVTLNHIFEQQTKEKGIRFIPLSHFKTDAGDGVHFQMKTYRQMAIQILHSI